MAFFREVICCRCKESFGLETGTYERLLRSSAFFQCPYGHQQHFALGDSEETKLRRERDRLKQEQARILDEAKAEKARLLEVANEAQRQQAAAECRAAAARGQVTKLKKSATAGVCPCCSHGFPNLARHIAAKHPEFVAESVEAPAEEQP